MLPFLTIPLSVCLARVFPLPTLASACGHVVSAFHGLPNAAISLMLFLAMITWFTTGLALVSRVQ
jgi:hypothetical protein